MIIRVFFIKSKVMAKKDHPKRQDLEIGEPRSISSSLVSIFKRNDISPNRHKKRLRTRLSMTEEVLGLCNVSSSSSLPAMSSRVWVFYPNMCGVLTSIDPADILLKPFPALSSKSSYESFTTARTSATPDVVTSLLPHVK
jgi:hypothetical protein